MLPKVSPPRPWEIDDLLDIGRKEGGKANYLKAIPILMLEFWITGERITDQANYLRVKWAKNRIERSGIREPFPPKGTSNIIGALSAIQKSRNLNPPLLQYLKPGIAWINLPNYESLLEEYRQKYINLYPEDYKKLFPNPNDVPEWLISEKTTPSEIKSHGDIIETDDNQKNNNDVLSSDSYSQGQPEKLTIIKVLENYEKEWQIRLERAEKRANNAEQEIIQLKEELERYKAEINDITEKINQSIPDKTKYSRPRIPEEIRVKVWRRDGGECARCGSRENLEFDHIVPISKGGSNTTRNIELLCEKCNRSKGNRTN